MKVSLLSLATLILRANASPNIRGVELTDQAKELVALSDSTETSNAANVLQSEECDEFMGKLETNFEKLLYEYTDEEIITYACADVRRNASKFEINIMENDMESQMDPCILAVEEFVADTDKEGGTDGILGDYDSCAAQIGGVLAELRVPETHVGYVLAKAKWGVVKRFATVAIQIVTVVVPVVLNAIVSVMDPPEDDKPVVRRQPDLDQDFVELATRCMELSEAVYDKERVSAIGTISDEDYYEYTPEGDSMAVDAALISREPDKGICIVSLRGTQPNVWKDVFQNGIIWEREVGSCTVREGWAQAFFGTDSDGNPIPGHFGMQMAEGINSCIDDGLKLVFTGHSQGGALALVGHLVYNEHTLWSITAAAPPTFVGEGEDPCPVVSNSQIYRFINTEDDMLELDYDVVPFVDRLPEKLGSLFQTVFPWAPDMPSRFIGTHKGLIALLPSQANQKIKILNNEAEMDSPTLAMLDMVDVLPEMSGMDFASAHDMATYKEKVDALLNAEAHGYGFQNGMRCNFNNECESGTCCVNTCPGICV